MKQKVKILITILLFIFSFYYTDKCVSLLKSRDPLMQEIINKKEIYDIAPIDAVITDSTIIPGNSGIMINASKSYDKMKKLGSFDESLLVYDEILPKKSYLNSYDKVIISGNEYNNKISLVFNIKNLAIYQKISEILSKYDLVGNYFFQNSFFSNNVKEISEIKDQVLVSSLINISKYKDIIDYCLVYEINNHESCINNKKYTVLSKLNIDNYHLTYTKNNIENGNIITYTFNENNVNDLDLVINYILNNNFRMVSLNDLLKE